MYMSQYCSYQSGRDWIAVYPALFCLVLKLLFHWLYRIYHSDHLVVPLEMVNEPGKKDDDEGEQGPDR